MGSYDDYSCDTSQQVGLDTQGRGRSSNNNSFPQTLGRAPQASHRLAERAKGSGSFATIACCAPKLPPLESSAENSISNLIRPLIARAPRNEPQDTRAAARPMTRENDPNPQPKPPTPPNRPDRCSRQSQRPPLQPPSLNTTISLSTRPTSLAVNEKPQTSRLLTFHH